MSQFGPNGPQKSFRAGASVSAYRVVAPDTATSNGHVRVIQIPTTTSFILGISQQVATAVDMAIPVVYTGYTKAAAGASVSAGALLTFVTTTAYVIEQANGTIATLTATTVGTILPKFIGIALGTGVNTDAVIEICLSVNNFRITIA